MQTNQITTSSSNEPEDRILWESADGAVIIRRRVHSAMRWPRHNAPIITLDVRVQEGSRIRPLRGGRVDICLEHSAQVALIKGLNEADPEVQYGVPSNVPQKPLYRKEYYDRINAERWRRKRRGLN